MPPKASAAAKKKASGGSSGKKLTGYQAFMKKEIKALKAANPGLDHKEAFKKVRTIFSVIPSLLPWFLVLFHGYIAVDGPSSSVFWSNLMVFPPFFCVLWQAAANWKTSSENPSKK